MPAARKKSVAQLGAERQRLYDDFNARETDDEKIDLPQLRSIDAIESKILKATFKTDADKLAGLRTLLVGEDSEPGTWCCFKSALYKKMAKYA
jgi:hypothetical protein